MCETRKFIMALLHWKEGLLCDKLIFVISAIWELLQCSRKMCWSSNSAELSPAPGNYRGRTLWMRDGSSASQPRSPRHQKLWSGNFWTFFKLFLNSENFLRIKIRMQWMIVNERSSQIHVIWRYLIQEYNNYDKNLGKLYVIFPDC